MLAPELNLCPRRSGVNAALNCDHFQPNKWAAAAAPNNGHWPRRVALAGVTTFICPGSGSKVPIPSLLPSRSISFVSRGLCRPVQACAGLCRPLWAQGSDALGSRQLGKLQGKERKCLTFRAAQDPFFAGGGGGEGEDNCSLCIGINWVPLLTWTISPLFSSLWISQISMDAFMACGCCCRRLARLAAPAAAAAALLRLLLVLRM